MQGLIFLAVRESDDCSLLAEAPLLLPTYTHPVRGATFPAPARGQRQSVTGCVSRGLLGSSGPPSSARAGGAWEPGSRPHTGLLLFARRRVCFSRESGRFGEPPQGNVPLAWQRHRVLVACVHRAPTVCLGLEEVMEIPWVCFEAPHGHAAPRQSPAVWPRLRGGCDACGVTVCDSGTGD